MKTKKKYIEVKNKIYIHPSVYLWDYLENKKMTIKDFADKSHINNTKLLKFVSLTRREQEIPHFYKWRDEL